MEWKKIYKIEQKAVQKSEANGSDCNFRFRKKPTFLRTSLLSAPGRLLGGPTSGLLAALRRGEKLPSGRVECMICRTQCICYGVFGRPKKGMKKPDGNRRTGTVAWPSLRNKFVQEIPA